MLLRRWAESLNDCPFRGVSADPPEWAIDARAGTGRSGRLFALARSAIAGDVAASAVALAAGRRRAKKDPVFGAIVERHSGFLKGVEMYVLNLQLEFVDHKVCTMAYTRTVSPSSLLLFD